MDPSLKPITEEYDLGDKKKSLKGKRIKIKKLVKKESGSFTLKDTYIGGEDSQDMSTNMGQGGATTNSNLGNVLGSDYRQPSNSSNQYPTGSNIDSLPLSESTIPNDSHAFKYHLF